MVMLMNVESIYEYDKLLERAYSLMPKKPKKTGERFKVPKLEIMLSGKRTFITNFGQFCNAINRDPRLVLRFLLKEAGAAGEIRDQMAVLQGEVKPKTIEKHLTRFIKEYVYCPVCGSPDTTLHKERRAMFIKCMACGAVSAVRPF